VREGGPGQRRVGGGADSESLAGFGVKMDADPAAVAVEQMARTRAARRIGERESGEAVFHEQGGRGGDRCAAFALDLQHARHLNGRARRCA